MTMPAASTRLVLVAAAAALTVATLAAVGRPASSANEPARARFAGVPQRGISLGRPDAPVTVVEFADLQCPFCAQYARDVLPAVVDRYVRPGRVRLELRVLAFLGPDSVRAGRVAAAASAQNRLWSFADAFYRDQGAENSGYATDAFLRRVLSKVGGVAVERAMTERDSRATDGVLVDARRVAAHLRVASTPSFYARRGSGPLRALELTGLTPEAFAAALEGALGDV